MDTRSPVAEVSKGSVGVAALAAALVSAVILAITQADYLRVYVPVFDDLSLVMHSAWQWIGARDALSWFTSGYTNYFNNYPGWQPVATGFVRPVENLAIWLGSLVVPLVGQSGYLTVNYVVVLCMAAVMTALTLRYGSRSPVISALFGVGVALSPVFHPSLFAASMGTNTLAALFSASSLLVLDARRGTTPGKVGWCALLQCLAGMFHETAALMPLIAFALLAYYEPDRSRLKRIVAPLVAPFVVLFVLRVMHVDSGHVYPLQRTIGEHLARIRWFAVHSVFPYDASRFWAQRAQYPAWRTAIGVAAFAVTLLLLVAAAVGLAARRSRRDVWLVVALGLALMSVGAGAVEARFQGYVVIVASIVLLELLSGSRLLTVVTAASLLVVGVLAVEGLAIGHPMRGAVAGARDCYAYLEEAITRSDPDTVVVVNERAGEFSAACAPEFAMGRHCGFYVAVVNTCDGPPEPGARLDITTTRRALIIDNELAPSQRALFMGNLADLSKPTRSFTYRPTSSRPEGGFVATHILRRGRTLVVGHDPRTGEHLKPILIVR